MSRKKTRPTALVTIQDIHPRSGFGVASWQRADGQECAVEVPFTLPGDVAEVEVGRRKRSYYQGRALTIVQPSAERCAPRCPHFGQCGGCRWQHMNYEEQCQRKQQRIGKLFAHLVSPETQIEPILPCTPPWKYRNKMEFSFSQDAAGQRYLGLMMQGGRQKVVNINECHLVGHWFSHALSVTRDWWGQSDLHAYHAYRDTGTLRTLTVREAPATGDRLAFLTVSGNADFALPKNQVDLWVQSMVAALTPSDGGRLSLFLRIQQIAKGQPTQFYEVHLHGPDHMRDEIRLQVAQDEEVRHLHCKVSLSAFSQPNWRLTGTLYSTALQMVPFKQVHHVWDLYCGTGVFALACAPYVQSVEGVEIVHEAILDARANADSNGLNSANFTVGDVAKVLPQWMEEKGRPDLVLVDPPRAGLEGNALQLVANCKAPYILYVSCNPTTQAADVEQLLQHGYRLRRMRAVDQFPHTVHVENIAVLSKDES